MRQKSRPAKEPPEQVVKDIRRATRRQFSAEEKIRIVLEGLRGEESIAELCRRERIVQNLYYRTVGPIEALPSDSRGHRFESCRGATFEQILANRPYESGQLSGNGSNHDRGFLAPGAQTPETSTEPYLRLPGNIPHRLWQVI